MFFVILFSGNWEIGPIEKDFGGGGCGTSLELCFDGPRKWRSVVFFQESVRYDGVFVFGVEEESIHVKETGSDWGETGMVLARGW